MDISRKCEMAAQSIRVIATHDDAPANEVDSALDALSGLIVKEKEAAAARRKATADAAQAKIAAAVGA